MNRSCRETGLRHGNGWSVENLAGFTYQSGSASMTNRHGYRLQRTFQQNSEKFFRVYFYRCCEAGLVQALMMTDCGRQAFNS